MEMGTMEKQDFFDLLCQTDRNNSARQLINYIEILDGNFNDYLDNIENLRTKESVVNLYLEEMINISENEDEFIELITILSEKHTKHENRIKLVSKILKDTNHNTILENNIFSDYINEFGLKRQKNKLKEIYEKQV